MYGGENGAGSFHRNMPPALAITPSSCGASDGRVVELYSLLVQYAYLQLLSHRVRLYFGEGVSRQRRIWSHGVVRYTQDEASKKRFPLKNPSTQLRPFFT